MLDILRKSASGPLAKILIGLLVLSFAAWGVNDIFSNISRQYVVKVGDETISPQQFLRAYQNEFAVLNQQTGGNASPEMVQWRTLRTLVERAALNAQASAMKLAVADSTIAAAIAQDPAFRNPLGDFDPRVFEQVLNANNLREADYVAFERKNLTRKQLLQPVFSTTIVPESMTQITADYRLETRVLDYFIIQPSATGNEGAPPEPSEQQLREFYEAGKTRFKISERRSFILINASPEDIASTIEVAGEDIEAEYERSKHNFNTPETRTVEQIAFPSRSQAEQAYQRLREGADFLEIARMRGFSAQEISLGQVRADQISDPTIRDIAFALPENDISPPIDGLLATMVVRVSEINPAVNLTLEDAYEQIRTRLALDQATEELFGLKNLIEDERAGGASLSEAAGKFNLAVTNFTGIDQLGGSTGNTQAELPEASGLLQVLFATPLDQEIAPLETTAGGYVWAELTNITPAGIKPYEQVKDQLRTIWSNEHRQEALLKRAREYTEQGNAASAITAITTLAGDAGVVVKTSSPLNRFERRAAPLSAQAVSNAFGQPQGGYSYAAASDGEGILVIQVKKINPAPVEQKNQLLPQLTNNLTASLEADIAYSLIKAIEDKRGVTINEALLGRLISDAGQQRAP